MNMISPPLTRKQIGDQTKLSGKDLTTWIRGQVEAGYLMSVMRHIDPAHSKKRSKFYCFVAQQQSLLS